MRDREYCVLVLSLREHCVRRFFAEILSPRNGEILDTRELKIRVTVEGYETPSSLHSSSMCVGLSSGAEYSEQCFDQTDLTFHANGLLAGANYGLRVALFGQCSSLCSYFVCICMPLPVSASSSVYVSEPINRSINQCMK